MSALPLFDTNPRTQKFALAVLRIFSGVVFAAHGYQKLFTFGIAATK